MQNKKIRVAVLFGGKSAEHEVSIQSAKNVFESLDKNKYDVSLIGIDKKGNWHKLSDITLLSSSFDQQISIAHSQEVRLISHDSKSFLCYTSGASSEEQIDVIFPVLHGPYGEDGSMQGFLTLMNVPFVGSSVLGSAVGMDKDVSKRLLRDAGLPVGDFMTFRKNDNISFAAVEKKLGLPFFVKPANLGSSIGVRKVKNKEEFEQAIAEAFRFDTKILIEQFIQGKEVECSVLGNTTLEVSVPGEIVASHEFYDYEAKYFDEQGAILKIPADIPAEKIKEVQALALRTFQALCLEGMARIDFFYTKNDEIFVNEANTIPGFTNISMYPKLWKASGMSYQALIDRLIELAIERYNEQCQLKTSL